MKCPDFQVHVGGSACHPPCESWARVDIRWSQTPGLCIYLDSFSHSNEISLTPQNSRSEKFRSDLRRITRHRVGTRLRLV
jgi:hypothetical protein